MKDRDYLLKIQRILMSCEGDIKKTNFLIIEEIKKWEETLE